MSGPPEVTGVAHPCPRVDPAVWFRALYATPHVPAAIASAAGVVLDANVQATDRVGFPAEQVVGLPFWDGPWWRGDPAVARRVREWCERAALGADVRAQTPWWDGQGRQRCVDLVVHRVTGPDGLPYLFLSGLDSSAAQAGAAEVRRAAEDLRLVADHRADSIRHLQSTSNELASALELSRHILDNVADGIYGLDAELRAVFVNPAAGRMLGYATAELLGRDMHELLHRTAEGGAALRQDCVAVRALRSGLPVRSDEETLRRADGSLLPVEAVAVPTVGDGRVTGVVMSFRDLTDRLASQQQAEQLRVLAQREAVRRVLTDRLQQAVLTPPPAPPGLQVEVRYRAAAAEASIGGDWYDAFVQPDGSTVLVIGDVLGHDSSAAAVMAQLRGLLRGIVYDSGEGPAGLLRRFEDAAGGLGIGSMATTVLARVRPGSDGHRRLVWCNAGHPSPALLLPDGTASLLRAEPDLLLGLHPDDGRTDHETVLPPGSTLLLFTDGLVERRGQDIDHGLALLTDSLGGLAGTDLGPLCDRLLELLVPGDAEDDVALVAVRVGASADGAPAPG